MSDDDMILCALCPTLLPRAETEYSEYHDGYLCAECLALVNGDIPDERDEQEFIGTRDLPMVKTCDECWDSFETVDADDDLCPRCQRDYLRENCPEALAEWDDQWEEGVVMPS